VTPRTGAASAAVLALTLVLLQASPAPLPKPLLNRGRQDLRLRTEEAVGCVDWDAEQRTVTLSGNRPPDYEEYFERVVAVSFQPTAATGLGPGHVAVAGRDGPRVRIEIWSLVETRTAEGALTWDIADRACVWEQVEPDAIGILMWNPVPPAGAASSLRAIWHTGRELVRFDVDARGWATPTLEATPHSPTPSGVLCEPDLAVPLQRLIQARHAKRGLVLMLEDPPKFTWVCEGGTSEDEIRLAFLDRDLDGRLDDVQRVDGPRWNAEEWGWLPSYERVFE